MYNDWFSYLSFLNTVAPWHVLKIDILTPHRTVNAIYCQITDFWTWNVTWFYKNKSTASGFRCSSVLTKVLAIPTSMTTTWSQCSVPQIILLIKTYYAYLVKKITNGHYKKQKKHTDHSYKLWQVAMWDLRWHLCLNRLTHNLHGKGFSPVWTGMWRRTWALFRKILKHTGHWFDRVGRLSEKKRTSSLFWSIHQTELKLGNFSTSLSKHFTLRELSICITENLKYLLYRSARSSLVHSCVKEMLH